MNILIVADSEAIMRIERYAVISALPDAQVRLTTTASEALDVIETWPPTVVVADYHLADMDGFAFLLAVRKRLPEAPIGFATSETDPQVARRVRAAGAAFFLSMPFQFEDLVEAVRGALVPVVAEGG